MKTGFISILLFSLFFVYGCENSNIFSWSHAEGKDKSTESLLVDAQKKLSDGDSADAIELYEEILAKDPDNSEALYGLASAELKNSGLDLASIIPKLISGDDDLEGAEDLIADLNIGDIADGTDAAVEALKKIADGQGDGTIPADDFDVNLNLGVALALNAVSSLVDWAEDIGAVEIKDDFSVIVSDTPPAGTEAQLIDAKEKIEEAVGYLETAAEAAGVDVSDVQDGFDDLILNLDAEIALL